MKLACLRTEEGQTISLTQILMENEIEKEYEELIKEEGVSVHDKDSKLDPKQQELRRLFESIKL